MLRFSLAAAVSLFAGTVAAAPLPDFVKDNIGSWLVVTDDGKPGCRVGLQGDTVKGGWRAIPAADCRERSPIVAKAVAWTFNGGVRLLDPNAQVLLDFQEDETTLMKTSFEKKPVFYIVKAAAGADRAPYAPALVGTWTLRRPGGAVLCTLTMAKDAKSEENELSLKTMLPCEPAVGRLKLNNARVEDFSLMLYGERDSSLRFEPSGPESYVKKEGGKPLEMVRR